MQRLRIRFCRGQEVKFISHLDIMRLWQRAFNRAGIALAYSEGFNPHPRLSLAAPLALGGLFMVGSASCYVAMEMGQDPSTFLWKHMLHLSLGVGAFFAMLSFPYQRLANRRLLVVVMLGTVGLTVVTGSGRDVVVAE